MTSANTVKTVPVLAMPTSSAWRAAGQKACVAQQAEEQHGAGTKGRTVKQNTAFRFGWWFGRCSRRHDAGARRDDGESACEHPCRVGAEGLGDPLAERRPEE